jgi:hypothetical protein
MKTIRALVLASLTAAAVFAADAVPAFNATLTVGKETRFVLLDSMGKASTWLKVGDTFEGYKLADYDAKAAALDLEKDGKITRISLAADAKVGAGTAMTPATIADATAVLDTMHFEEMLDKSLAGVKKQQVAMIDRMMGQMGGKGVDKEDLVAFQKKVVDEMMSAINGADLKNDVAKIYSEVFSKEELQSLANFYSSPIGQTFSDKQPEITEKMQAVMIPRMMAVMPKIQQMGQEFAMQQRAKQQAAAEAAAPAPAPTPTPAPASAPKE